MVGVFFSAPDETGAGGWVDMIQGTLLSEADVTQGMLICAAVIKLFDACEIALCTSQLSITAQIKRGLEYLTHMP